MIGPLSMSKPAKAVYRVLGYYPTMIRGTKLKLDPYNADFWRFVSLGRWENGTYDAMDAHLTQDSTYLDVGAWIGPTVVYAAPRVKKVYCFEPDAAAYRYLLWNLQLNRQQNVTPFNLALARSTEVRRMASLGERLGDSMTSFLGAGDGKPSTEVYCVGWADWLRLANPGRIDFIKVDIEGGEFELLPAMADYLREHRPVLHLSFHTPFLPERERAERIEAVMDVLKTYRNCYDDRRQPVAVAAVETVAATGYPEFLFTA